MLPGPAIPILSQVFFVTLENKLDYTENMSNYDLKINLIILAMRVFLIKVADKKLVLFSAMLHGVRCLCQATFPSSI
jgi:hypothetical protein